MKRVRVSANKPLFWLTGFLICLILLCLSVDSLELTYGLRADLSFNELTTPSMTTREVVAHLSYPVHIYAVFRKGNEDMFLFELLNRYRALSDLITWEQADIALNPSLVTRFQGGGEVVKEESVIVYCPAMGRYRVLQSADFVTVTYHVAMENYQMGLGYEKKISEALLYVTREHIYQTAVLKGHGELDEHTLGYFTSFLQSNRYEVSFVNLLAGDTLPGDALLMILSPVRDLHPVELTLLTAFANDGGAFFITLDPGNLIGNMPNFLSLFRLYGFHPLSGVVMADPDERSTYYDRFTYVVIPELLPTAVTAPLIASSQDELWLCVTGAFQMPSETDKALTAEAMAVTTGGAYLADADTFLPRNDGVKGPFALSLLASRVMESSNLSRALIIGNSTLLTDPNLYAGTDCGAFILGGVRYLLDESILSLPIEQKPFVRPALSASVAGPGLVTVIVIPLSILLVSLAVLLPRRRRG